MNIDRFIAENVMHVCWHKADETSWYGERCSLCGLNTMDDDNKLFSLVETLHPNYSTGKHKTDLMNFCVEQEWWLKFWDWAYFDNYLPTGEYRKSSGPLHAVFTAYLWRSLRELVAVYHGYKE